MDPLTLQIIAVAAIVVFGLFQVGFGLFQAVMALDMRRRGKHATHEHQETMAAWQDQHQETMAALSDQREADQRRHTEAMTALENQRQEIRNQHEQTTTALGAQQRSTDELTETARRALRLSDQTETRH